MRRIKGSLFLVLLGLFIWMVNMDYLSFWDWGRDWPWIIIIIGLSGIIKHLFFKPKHRFNVNLDKEVIGQKGARIASEIKKVVKDVVAKVEKGEMSAEKAAEKIREEEQGTASKDDE